MGMQGMWEHELPIDNSEICLQNDMARYTAQWRKARAVGAGKALTFPAVSATTTSASVLSIPLPGIILLAISAYIIVLLFLLLIHQCLRARGCCPSCMGWQKVGGLGLCDACESCAQSCDCRVPTVARCMDSCCPSKPTCSCCHDVSCCPCEASCCPSDVSCCSCGFPSCPCDFSFKRPDCTTVNCIFCEMNLRQ
ncbi:uncharacterized protein PAF06_013923 [Gastrophryne carolinensis]